MKIEQYLSKFSNNLKAIRKDKGLTQDQLAELSGLSRRVIGHLETNAINPPIDTIISIAAALNVTIEELFGIEEYKTENSDISFKILKKARIIDKLPTRAQNEIIKHVNELADRFGIQ